MNLLTQRIQLFPHSIEVRETAHGPSLHLAGLDLAALAETYGTPLYLYDEATIANSIDAYQNTLAEFYPGPSGITYAGKAFLCLALAGWLARRGLWVDCTGVGELAIAAAAGVPQAQTLVHGVSKSPADLAAAVAQAGVIVVDHLGELERLNAWPAAALPQLWLRLRPGVAVETHSHNQTGQEDSKFGMSLSEGRAAVRFALEHGLPLKGVHFHLGSHFHDPRPLAPALRAVLDWIAAVAAETGWLPETLCPGGGWGVPYHEADLPHPDPASFARLVAEEVRQGCAERGLPLLRLQLEPGRSIIAQSGVALYRVNASKQTTNRRWLLLDGGLADNPRPTLYAARYSALPVNDPARPAAAPAWLGGPYCESGDVLIEDLPLPEIQIGEFLAVPVSGAYQLSMSSHYNGARRPAVLWLKAGRAHLIQRRETPDDLLRNDQQPAL